MFFAPFLLIYWFIFLAIVIFLFAMLGVGAINYALQALGLPPNAAFYALLASLLGSYINIPITRIEGSAPYPVEIVSHYGIRYRVPLHLASGNSTVIALNVGGAIVPLCITAWVLASHPEIFLWAIVGTVIVTLVVHRAARPIPGVGIATPLFVPPIIAAIVGWVFGGGFYHHASAIAYVSGVMGTLIGADLMNLGRLSELGAPVASIGGAGTFDGIFLTGIVAVLLA
ncbi:MAG TPA: DUF1614 domain-containing protein [Candidatus Binataceae bacterium]|jgi:uncharacterized membrane protein|nr:DUF1614 domain-containing protein [Candidatus Binataceae bacterium]